MTLTITAVAIAGLALGALVATAVEGRKWEIAAKQMRQAHHFDLSHVRDHLTSIVTEERARNEHLSRLLDQYRAEGIQNPSYQDYGPPTPIVLKPLPKEAEEWLSGLGDEVRAEYEEEIRARVLEKGEDLADVLLSMSQVA